MFFHDYVASDTMSTHLKDRIRRCLPKRLKRHRIHGGPLAGAAIFTSWHDYPGAILGRTEKPLIEWFRQHVKSSETWIDIGAHYGYTAIALARLVGEQGRVFACEPILATAACLARTKEINEFSQLTVIPLGLSASPRAPAAAASDSSRDGGFYYRKHSRGAAGLYQLLRLPVAIPFRGRFINSWRKDRRAGNGVKRSAGNAANSQPSSSGGRR